MKLRMIWVMLTVLLLAACGLDSVDVALDEPILESTSPPEVVTVVVVVTATPEVMDAVPSAQSNQDTPTEPTPKVSAGDSVTDEPPPNLPAAFWQPIPDLPRQINDLVIDRQNPRVIYAATGSSGSGSGVYKSEDAGLTWHLSADGLPNEDVRALAIGSGDPPVLIAAVGRGDIYTSFDSAKSWTRLGSYELPGFKAQLAVAPSDPNLIFAVEDVRGLYRSLDGGRSWLSTKEGLPKDDNDIVNVQAVAIDPQNADLVYVGTGWGSFNANGVYKSTDRGETWAPANRGMIDYGITALSVNPVDSQVIYAGGEGGELFKSSDGGENWNELTDRLPSETGNIRPIRSIVMNPDEPNTIYLLKDWSGIMVSKDGGERWRLIGKPGEPDLPSFSTLAVIFDPQPILVIGIENEGGWRNAAPAPETSLLETS